MRKILTLTVALLLAATACSSKSSSGGGGDNHYAGKTITLLIPFSPGGSTDVVARLIAKDMGQYIPGHPKIVAKNLPGGGGAVAMKRVAQARDDGLTVVTTTSGVDMRWLLKAQGHDYPLQDMPLVGGVVSTDVQVVRKDVATSTSALVAADGPIRAGNTSADSGIALGQAIQMKLLGVPLKEVYGYSGIGDVAAAMQRNEIDVAGPPDLSYLTTYQPLVDDGLIVPLWQDGVMNDSGQIVPDNIVPDVPLFADEYQKIKGEQPSGPLWDAYKTVIAAASIETSIFMPPKTPQAYVTTIGDAFQKMTTSEAFKAATKKSFGAELETLDSAAANKVFQEFAQTSQSTRDLLSNLT